MFLLADSGATKTDWILFDGSGTQKRLRTSGINPMVQTEVQIRTNALTDLSELLTGEKIDKVFYYGAGLRTTGKVEIMTKLLKELFPEAEMEVNHDLLGAARATCGDEKGITCILGTGSNSCWYDGNEIKMEIGGHGYILGDEGSGADLGKTLVKKALDNELPENAKKDLEEYAGKPLLELRNEIYQHPRPNYYFASLAKYIAERKEQPLYHGLVLGRLTTFIGKTVIKYYGYPEMPVHFIGSIAQVFEKELRMACEIFSLKMGRIVQAPAETLVEYHLTRMKAHQ